MDYYQTPQVTVSDLLW